MDKDIIIVNETDSIDLVCESINSLPITNSSWFNENSNHYENFITKDEEKDVFKNTLRIIEIDESDNGSFECFMKNDAGEDKITFELLVQTMPKIDEIKKTNGEEIEVDGEMLEGDDVTLDCVVDGFPMPEVSWFKDQQRLETVRSESSLVLENISERDAGNYQCLATNVLGIATKLFHVKVNAPPKVENPSDHIFKIIENANVELSCEIGGKPEPDISWHANGNQLTERFKLSSDNKTLTFEAHLSDSGIYSCTGVNGFGSTTMNFTVLVLGMNVNSHKMLVNNFNFVFKGLPKILQQNDESMKGKIGEELSLPCGATGFPQVIS